MCTLVSIGAHHGGENQGEVPACFFGAVRRGHGRWLCRGCARGISVFISIATFCAEEYKLADGRVVTIFNGDALPWLVGVSSLGIHELAFNTICKCDDRDVERACTRMSAPVHHPPAPSYSALGRIYYIGPTAPIRCIIARLQYMAFVCVLAQMS